MKRIILIALLGFGGIFLGGCVAIPPLINVEHKHSESQTTKKLDDIEKRLDRLENKLDHRP